MPSPHETQARLRDCVVGGAMGALDGMLSGGLNPQGRLAIYRRHHLLSLREAILTKFPATFWLLGYARMREAATAYVQHHRPTSPAIADYGSDFPAFLAGHPMLGALPYAGGLARLEWLVGKAAIAAPAPAAGLDMLAAIPGERLPDTQLRLLDGVAYLAAGWPVDELMRLFVTETAPDQMTLADEPVLLEVRGGRGSFQIQRLTPPRFSFRHAIAAGAPLGEAIEAALRHESDFDFGGALVALFAEQLVGGTAPAPANDSTREMAP